MFEDENHDIRWTNVFIASVVSLVVIAALFFAVAATSQVYGRHQRLANAKNAVKVTEIQIQNTHQLVEVENQKAAVRVAEANGIAEAQKIINQTLTPLYLQHEAIKAQLEMAHSENHTIVYIPIGNEGIPLVGTTNTVNPAEIQ